MIRCNNCMELFVENEEDLNSHLAELEEAQKEAHRSEDRRAGAGLCPAGRRGRRCCCVADAASACG